MKSDEFIHDRGRGPEIEGTRITVFAILDYLLLAWPPDQIATSFRLSSEQVRAAIDYINEHTIEVLRDYIKIVERAERGNPPEVQAIVDANHEKFLETVAKIRQIEETDPGARQLMVTALIEEFRRSTTKVPVHADDNGRP